jgi:uncharacterized protein YggT (Ycf19 family)
VSLLVQATVRSSIADYLDALITVYWIIILAYILLGWIDMFGGRIPYSRAGSAIIGFIRAAAMPYLGLFRRFLPPMGGFDFSPIIGIFVLIYGGRLIVNAVRG